jgi:hypothetical protein
MAAVVEHAASPVFAGLTPEQVQKFNNDGFLAIPNFASKQQVRPGIGAA